MGGRLFRQGSNVTGERSSRSANRVPTRLNPGGIASRPVEPRVLFGRFGRAVDPTLKAWWPVIGVAALEVGVSPVLAGDQGSTGCGAAEAVHAEGGVVGDHSVIDGELVAGLDRSACRQFVGADGPCGRFAAVVAVVGCCARWQDDVGVVADGKGVDVPVARRGGEQAVQFGGADEFGRRGGSRRRRRRAAWSR